jgi:ABC-type transport system substrate-binding protein
VIARSSITMHISLAHRRKSTCHALGMVAAWCIVLMLVNSVSAQDRLIDVEPFDEITLNAQNGNAVLKTLPLEFRNRIVPEVRTGKIRMRLVDRPKRLYECDWQNVTKVRLFEQMVLEDAEKLTAKGNYDEAFEYYNFLARSYPKVTGLSPSIDLYLYKHASAEVKAGRNEHAFVLLTELVDRKPDIPNLDRAYESVTARVITERIKEERYDAARGAITLAETKFASTALTKVLAQRDALIAEATSLRDTAQRELASGQLRKAQLASNKGLAIWPELEGIRELTQEIARKYPVAAVGVFQPASAATGRSMDDWASRRISRLLTRQLVELNGFSAEGGIYRSPLGSLARDDSGVRWSIQLRPEIVTDNGLPLYGYDIARQLLALPLRNSPTMYDAWRDVFRSVSVKQVYGVQIELSRPLVRPERLLEAAEANQIPWPNAPSDKSPVATPSFLRPYQLGSIGEETRFDANRQYFGYGSSQPQEVIERHFADTDEATKALRRGEVDVLDRVCPWDVGVLKNSETIAVERYLLPTVHVLMPNPQRPPAANRTLRRAILYGINRQAILEQALLAGRAQDGTRVVSGPFAANSSVNDVVGYGNDNAIQPANYEPRLAIALYSVALKELNPEAKASDSKKKEAAPVKKLEGPLVIAHLAEPVARLACTGIVEHLKRVGIEAVTQEFDGSKGGPGDDYDFLYAELAAWEPVADARRLFGEQGLTGGCSAYMSLALAKLDQAVTWKDIRRRMAEVHRIAANELVVIPLWQTVNFYAYRRGTADVGKLNVTLYQQVEQWKQTQPVATR